MNMSATSEETAGSSAPSSSWSPLQGAAFRSIWLATLVSNLGGWMQAVGAAWLMTSITPSPLLVSLVQTAAGLPIFLLALPAGALADIFPRRRLLLISNYFLLAVVSGLAACTLSGHATPAGLLAFTFGVGLGEALEAPPFQAIVSDLVPKSQLVAAVSLNSVGYNLARAIGPALGGLVVARFGAGTNFAVNALSFSAVLVVLHRWRETVKKSVLPAERFTGAIRAGLRYVRYSPELGTVLVRTASFVVSGSALWALLPIVVRELKRGPSAYGVLLGSLGAGALIGAAMLPSIRGRLSLDALVGGATAFFGVATLASAFVHSFAFLILLMLLAGVGWIALLSSLNVATRAVVPAWIQARALAVYLLVFQGGMALGSLIWGSMATHFGVRAALAAAGAFLLLTIPLALSHSLKGGQAMDLASAPTWPEPQMSIDRPHDSAPVLVTVQYKIDPLRLDEFRGEMEKMEAFRRRDGALEWGLFADPIAPGCYLEEFVVESWLSHERQHERLTVTDQLLHDRIWALHLGAEPPRVRHFIADERPR